MELKNESNINETIGLWIKMINDDVLVINGTTLDNTSFNLKQGWNLIGYPSLIENNINYVFEDVSDELISVLTYENNNWKSYSPLRNDQLNSLKTMKPGYGCWVKTNKDTSWVFEDNQYKKIG